MAQSAVDTELETLIRARYPIIYVVSWEEKRVEDALRAITKARGKKMYQWTVTQGMVLNPLNRDEATREPAGGTGFCHGIARPGRVSAERLSPIPQRHVSCAPNARSDICPQNLLQNADFAVASAQTAAGAGKRDHRRRLRAALTRRPGRLLDSIIDSVKANPQVQTELTTQEREQVLSAALGLTATEAENVFAKSLVEKRKFDVDVILSEKEQIIRKSAILEYYRTSDAFADVGGVDLLKDWMDKRTVAFTEKAREYGLPSPKGILLLGVQGLW